MQTIQIHAPIMYLNVPYTTPYKFPSLFENVVSWSLKSFFELDQQVNISLYLTKATALHHSRELHTRNMIFNVTNSNCLVEY